MNLKSIIEKHDTTAGKIFDYFIQFLIILSLISFTIETIPDLSHEFHFWLYTLEVFTVIVFSIEYLLRIFVADNKLKFIFSFYGLIDLFAILPFYVSRTIDLRSIRIFRLLRLFRAFKLLRYSKALKRFQSAFLMIKEELITFFIITIFMLFFSSVGIYYFESSAQPDKFTSIFDCMWWSVATLTTVGYGDVFPVTIGGKIFTFFILLIGLGIIAVPTGLIASALTKCIEEEKTETDSSNKK
jgi:voltage-gated potassium channel